MVGAGGRAKTVGISFNLPPSITEATKLTVFIDELQDCSMDRDLRQGEVIITLFFKGTMGRSRVEIKLNNVLYKEYNINFDDCTYNEIK